MPTTRSATRNCSKAYWRAAVSPSCSTSRAFRSGIFVSAAAFIFIVGLVTLGLGWILYWLLSPTAVIWAICYYGLTFGSPASATIGMRVMDIEMRTWYGAPAYFVLGAVHAVVYWVTISFLTPLILLVAFFNARRRLLHDMLVGTIVINTGARAQALRRTSRPQGI